LRDDQARRTVHGEFEPRSVLRIAAGTHALHGLHHDEIGCKPVERLLSWRDLGIQLDQQFDGATVGSQHRNRNLPDVDVDIDGGASDRPGNHAVVLEDVPRAFDENPNDVEIEPPLDTYLGRKTGNARIDVDVVQHARVERVVPDRRNGVEHHHGLNVRDAHVADVEGGCVQAGGTGMEVDGQVGIGPEQSVEHQSGPAADGADAAFVAGPFAVHVGQLETVPGTRPATLHALHCRSCNGQNRHDRVGLFLRVQPAFDRLYGVHRTQLVTVLRISANLTGDFARVTDLGLGAGLRGWDRRNAGVGVC
jgi:hypothetical protein